MKLNTKQNNARKLRYGGVTAALTALMIAIIVVFNVIFSALAQKQRWYTDLTSTEQFTLSQNCIDLIQNGDEEFDNPSTIETVNAIREEKKQADSAFKNEDLMIRLIFCDDKDVWESSATRKMIYETALQLQKEFPDHIRVENHNIIQNPDSVRAYDGVNSTSQVIIEFGTEYRVRGMEDFFEAEDETLQQIYSYYGEKIFAAAILAVTRAEAPIACVVNNHGETTPIDLAKTLDLAGFEVQGLDLAQQAPADYEGDVATYSPIPKNCRLLIICNPTADFLESGQMSADGSTVSSIDEIDRLDDFLVGDTTGSKGSMMVFLSCETRLNNLEDYLAEWGIVFDRDELTSYPYRVIDKDNSLDYQVGSTILSQYVKGGAGGELTASLWENINKPRPVVFKNATSLSFAPTFTAKTYTNSTDASKSYPYAVGGANGAERSVYEVFTSSSTATAQVNGTTVAKATEANPFALMMISVQTETTQTSQWGDYVVDGSYVLACGTPEFASGDFLQSNAYGNTIFLEYAFRTVGQESVPVGLTFKTLNDSTIDTVTTKEATQYTVTLTLVPIVVALCVGAVVLIRRKNR